MNKIKNHFKKYAPKEACGVFIDNFKFIECKNISEDTDTFCFCPEEYFNIIRTYKIEGIVHNHINAPNTPSNWDITGCNAMAIPYYIYSYPDMKLNVLLPKLTVGVKQ